MSNICCFCVYECAGTDILKKDKNQTKMIKTSTRLERARNYEIKDNLIWSIVAKDGIMKDYTNPKSNSRGWPNDKTHM